MKIFRNKKNWVMSLMRIYLRVCKRGEERERWRDIDVHTEWIRERNKEQNKNLQRQPFDRKSSQQRERTKKTSRVKGTCAKCVRTRCDVLIKTKENNFKYGRTLTDARERERKKKTDLSASSLREGGEKKVINEDINLSWSLRNESVREGFLSQRYESNQSPTSLR